MQRLPSPVGNGWELSEGVVKPVLMIKEAAAEGLAELAVCKCDKSSCKSNLRYLCRMNEMPCTEAQVVGAWQMKTVRIRTTQTMLMTAVTMRFNCVKYKDFIRTAFLLCVSR